MPSKFSSKGLPARLAPFFLFMLAALTVRPGPPRIIKPKDGPAFRDDRILIIPKPGHAAALNLLHLKTGVKILKAFPATANIQVLEVPAANALRIFTPVLR